MRPEDGDERPGRLIEAAQRALIAMRLGQDDEAIEQVRPSPEPPDQGPAETRALILLLFSECSQLVATLGDGGAAPVKVQVFDAEGEEVSIDQAEPPVRTAVRTLLAEVHGNPAAAAEQVEIALTNAAPDEVTSLLLQALRWTIRLSGECLERGLPVTSWIAEAMSD